ncbi:hypothetical protein EHS25_002844 [Saitozyma podzolica]|uniref:Uncharacterized protein n=1 Tax=Saitozyma podzolica TaxID=1890683 RepID=A0A427YCD6_9TREE|nr:hypothetical protein EHS25_002844 [Saitozyma podzolica]
MLLGNSILTLLVPALWSLEGTFATPLPSVPESNCTTNAECIREGKPLLKPQARSKTSGLHPRQSGSSGTNPTSYTGYIKVADEINGGGFTTIGYLGFAEGVAAGVFTSIYGPYLGANGPYGSIAGSEGYIGMTNTQYAGLLQPVSTTVPYGAGSVDVNDAQYPSGGDMHGVETAIWNLNPTYGDLRLIWTDGRGGYGGIQPWYTTDGTPADFGLGTLTLSGVYGGYQGANGGKSTRTVALVPYIPGVYGTP